ncbi:MAG: hypothetical protein JW941_13335 [Candidatus Coatesbacteria bacterium]|nr:hypothetical protein [Candidatus Coatesbacteria bacterium]
MNVGGIFSLHVEELDAMTKQNYQAKTGIVVMLDALGVRNMTVDQCRHFIERRDVLLRNRPVKVKELRSELNQLKIYKDVPENVPEPEVVTFADNIVFTWQIQQRPEIALRYLSFQWLSFLIACGIKENLPFRGAIAIGEYIQQDHTVLGPAVTDAAAWHERGDWIGIIATPKAGEKLAALEKEMQECTQFMDEAPAWIVRYNVPIKSPCHIRNEMWTVPWPFHFGLAEEHSGIPSDKLFKRLIDRIDRPPKAESKYKNTYEYFSWYRQNIMPKLPRPTTG